MGRFRYGADVLRATAMPPLFFGIRRERTLID